MNRNTNREGNERKREWREVVLFSDVPQNVTNELYL